MILLARTGFDQARGITMTGRMMAIAVLLAATAGIGHATAADMPAKGRDAEIRPLLTCAYGTYTVIAGDTCAKVYLKVYCDKAALFTKYNGYTCTTLAVGKILCKPKKIHGRCV